MLQSFNAEDFGEKVYTLRLKKGMYSEKLATALGVSRSTVNMWESGKRNPTLKNLYEIANFFGVRVPYLLGYEN